YDGHRAERLIGRSQLLGSRDAARQVLGAQYAEPGAARVAIERNQSPSGEEALTAAGQHRAGAGDRDACGELIGRAEGTTDRQYGRRRVLGERRDRVDVGTWVSAPEPHHDVAGSVRGRGRGGG